MKKYIMPCLAALSSMSTLFFGWAYYEFYWRWNDCFNEAGRCFDEQSGVVYLEQSGLVWGSLAIISFGFAVFFLWYIKRKQL